MAKTEASSSERHIIEQVTSAGFQAAIAGLQQLLQLDLKCLVHQVSAETSCWASQHLKVRDTLATRLLACANGSREPYFEESTQKDSAAAVGEALCSSASRATSVDEFRQVEGRRSNGSQRRKAHCSAQRKPHHLSQIFRKPANASRESALLSFVSGY